MSDIYPVLTLLLLFIAAMTDLTARIIRNWVSLAILLLFVLYAASPARDVDVLPHLFAAVVLFLLLFVGFAFGKIGGGDVKLASVTMLWAGPGAAADFLFVTALAGGALALLVISPQAQCLTALLAAPLHRFVRAPAPALASTVPYGVAIAAGGGVALYGRYLAGG